MDSDVAQNSSHTSRWLALWEVVAVVGLIEVYLWFLKGTSHKLSKNMVVISIVAAVGFSFWNHRPQLPEKTSLVQSWLKILVGSVLLASILMLCAWGLGVINVDSYSSFWAKFLSDQTWWKRKVGTVVAQQIALQLCLLPACMTLCKSRWKGIALSSFLFGMIHSPNPYLMLITIAGGCFWCWMWLDSRRMMPLICSHLLLAILAREYCNDALYNMRVGAKVLDLFQQSVQSASGESFINDPMLLRGEWNALKVEGDEVTCRGWAVDVRKRQLIDELVVYSAVDQVLSRFPVERVHSDYSQEVCGPNVQEAGFRLRLPLKYFRGAVKIYAYRDGIGYSRLLYMPEKTPDKKCNPYVAARKRMREERIAKAHKRNVH
ncbi:CPBP family intramembrane metalloprotease [Planctomycetaceae bacterium]|nr:CPBP family intramembrane metalloprotease [Planctomycetaceae bacterium]MDB4786842.1 CPBP family intramembrane metalloprotease [Planctomycetaceae bacterium]